MLFRSVRLSALLLGVFLFSGCNDQEITTPGNGHPTPTPTPGSQTNAVNLMMLGDSITNTTCYPPFLYEALKAGGYTKVTFIGTMSMNAGSGVTCDGKAYYDPPRNEGHSAYSTAGIISSLPGWLSDLGAVIPDVVLVHLGTNNFWGNYVAPQSTLDDYTSIVGILRDRNPDVKMVFAQIIPMLYSSTSASSVADLDAAMPAWAASTSTTRSPVYVVDLYDGFDTDNGYADAGKVHPNEAGSQWMADRVYPFLISLF